MRDLKNGAVSCTPLRMGYVLSALLIPCFSSRCVRRRRQPFSAAKSRVAVQKRSVNQACDLLYNQVTGPGRRHHVRPRHIAESSQALLSRSYPHRNGASPGHFLHRLHKSQRMYHDRWRTRHRTCSLFELSNRKHPYGGDCDKGERKSLLAVRSRMLSGCDGRSSETTVPSLSPRFIGPWRTTPAQ